MNAAGLKVRPHQIALPGKVMANTPDPVLTVGAIERWGDQQLRVRIDCADHVQCIPFFVVVLRTEHNEGTAPSAGPTGATQPRSNSEPASSPIAVRSGAPAVLLLEGDHIHIKFAVICLQNGRVGQTIRVETGDRRQVYSAEVVDYDALKGRLQ